MRKSFDLRVTGKKDERVLDGIKHEIRKYIAREQRKKLPTGSDRWEFNCEVGADDATATRIRISDVIPTIDAIAKSGVAQVFVEILAFPGKRPPRPEPQPQTPPREGLEPRSAATE